MPFGFDDDSHSQDGSACPRNFFGLTDYKELAQREAFYVTKRITELEAGEVTGSFDATHLKRIHQHLFQDVFPWAGEFRRVGLAKVGGAPFALPMYIESSLHDCLGKLRDEGFLRKLNTSDFATRAAAYLGDINAIHAFREGNGRTQREFIRQLASQAEHRLSWGGFTAEENVAASVRSHLRGDNSGLAAIIRSSVKHSGGSEA